MLLGFRAGFSSFAEAQASANRALPVGHEHADDIRVHTALSNSIRESDYPVLFHLAPIAPELRRVFDLGGNVGNLFYAYQRLLKFNANLRWLVLDLPAKRAAGEALAITRGETRIHYAASLNEASGADLLVVSGALHYFETPLDELLRQLDKPPRWVVVNRSPCSAGEDLITVQDAGTYLVPCKLYGRQKLIAGMTGLGYALRDSWEAHERQLWLPLYPEASHFTYFGFFFELQTGAAG